MLLSDKTNCSNEVMEILNNLVYSTYSNDLWPDMSPCQHAQKSFPISFCTKTNKALSCTFAPYSKPIFLFLSCMSAFYSAISKFVILIINQLFQPLLFYKSNFNMDVNWWCWSCFDCWIIFPLCWRIWTSSGN